MDVRFDEINGTDVHSSISVLDSCHCSGSSGLLKRLTVPLPTTGSIVSIQIIEFVDSSDTTVLGFKNQRA